MPTLTPAPALATTAASPSSSPNAPLARLSLGHFLVDAYAGFMLPILPLLALNLGFGLSTTGILLMVSSATSSILQPLYGWVSEHLPWWNFLFLGVLLAGLFIALVGICPNLSLLALCIALGYLGVGLYHPTATTMVHGLQKTQQNLLMGCFISAGSVGFAVGPLLAAFLVERGGLPATLWAALPALVALPFFVNLRPQSATLPPTTEDASETVVAREGWFTRAETRLLGKLIGINLVRTILIVGLPAFMPFLWKSQGYTVLTGGIVIALSSLIGGPLGLLSGHWADRYGERRILLATFLPAVVLMPVMAFSEGMLSFAAFVLVISVLEASLSTNLVLALRGIRHKPNVVSSLVGGFSFGLAGLFMPLIGRLSDTVGIPTATALLTLPLLIGVVLILRLPKQLMGNHSPHPPITVEAV